MEEGVSWVRAVDSFIAQNETDLGFKEGDLIQGTSLTPSRRNHRLLIPLSHSLFLLIL